jgi:purine-nucleoside phosphorylase
MEMGASSKDISSATANIRERTRYRPVVGLVLGSGLSGLADAVPDSDLIPYDTIPHWPVSTAPGHTGRLVIGRLEGQEVLIMQGRAHFYEGYSISQLAIPVRVMHALGIRTLLLTNAAGGLNPTFQAGDLMLISDHLNFPGMAGHNPLRGPNLDDIGPRFPDMTAPYDPALRQLAHEVAVELGFTLKKGIYAYVAGPNYETPAELRFLRTAGADAVGMSTVPSVLVARHAGIRVLGISTITNLAHPDPPAGTELTHAEVLAVGAQVVPRLTSLIHALLRRL